jgi:hypothetical protein
MRLMNIIIVKVDRNIKLRIRYIEKNVLNFIWLIRFTIIELIIKRKSWIFRELNLVKLELWIKWVIKRGRLGFREFPNIDSM